MITKWGMWMRRRGGGGRRSGGELVYHGPSSPGDQELKRLFDEAAGADHVRFPYGHVYSLVRRLMRFVVQGMRTSEHLKEAEALLSCVGCYSADPARLPHLGVLVYITI